MNRYYGGLDMDEKWKKRRRTSLSPILTFPETKFLLMDCEIFQLMTEPVANASYWFIAYENKYTFWKAYEGFPNPPNLHWITRKTTTKGVAGDDMDSVRDYVRDYEINRGYLYTPSCLSPDPTWNNSQEMLWENDWRAISPSNPHDKDYGVEVSMVELDRALRLGRGQEAFDIRSVEYRIKKAEKSNLWDYSASKFQWGIEGMALATVNSVGFYIPWNTAVDLRYTKVIWQMGYQNLIIVYKTQQESIGAQAFMEVLGYIPFANDVIKTAMAHVRYILPLVPAFARKDTLSGYTSRVEGELLREQMKEREDISAFYVWEVGKDFGYMLKKQYEVWFEGMDNVPVELLQSDITVQTPVVSQQGVDYVEVSTDRETEQKTMELPGLSGINYPMNIESFRMIETMYRKGLIPQWQFVQISQIFKANGII